MTREATHAPGIHRIRVCPESLKAGFAYFLLFTRNLTLATPPPYSPRTLKSRVNKGEIGQGLNSGITRAPPKAETVSHDNAPG